MKKVVLLPLIIAFFTSCKKDGNNKVTYPASDSIYLVSTVTESNTNLVGTETFTYDSQHRIIKDVINNSLQISYTNPTFYTFIYNTDGTLASMTYTVNGNLAGKYDFSY